MLEHRAVLLLFGAVSEQVIRWRSASVYPAPGTMVDIGTHSLHMDCRGEGTPTVLLEAGLTRSGSLSWANVHDEIAEFTRVCAYDRAGIMWSEGGPRPRSGERIAGELGALLSGAGESGPFVLVGQSMGGVHIRLFAERYRDDVVGMVFVDSSHPEQDDRLPEEISGLEPPRLLMWAFGLVDRVGLGRLAAGSPRDPFPDSVRPILARFAPQSSRAADAEAEALALTNEEARNTGPFDSIPLVVLNRGVGVDATELPEWTGITPEVLAREAAAWSEMQLELAALSSVGRQQTVGGAGHNIQLDRPDVVIQAIRDVVDAATSRSGSRVER